MLEQTDEQLAEMLEVLKKECTSLKHQKADAYDSLENAFIAAGFYDVAAGLREFLRLRDLDARHKTLKAAIDGATYFGGAAVVGYVNDLDAAKLQNGKLAATITVYPEYRPGVAEHAFVYSKPTLRKEV